jgi:hypothetical protein
LFVCNNVFMCVGVIINIVEPLSSSVTACSISRQSAATAHRARETNTRNSTLYVNVILYYHVCIVLIL